MNTKLTLNSCPYRRVRVLEGIHDLPVFKHDVKRHDMTHEILRPEMRTIVHINVRNEDVEGVLEQRGREAIKNLKDVE